MRDFLLLLAEDLSAPWHWCAGGEKGGDGKSASGIARNDIEKSALSEQEFSRLIVIVPGQNIIVKPHDLSALKPQQKLQAARFGIEEELAMPLEDTHIVLAANSDHMAIVSHEYMQNILTILQEYGLSPDIICADYDLLNEAGGFVLVGRVIIKNENGLGLATDKNIAETMPDISISSLPEIDIADYFSQGFAAIDNGHKPLNLLQYEYAKRQNRLKRGYLLYPAAGILAVFIIGNIVLGMANARKSAMIEGQIKKIYSEIYPDKTPPSNPARAILNAQKNNKSGNMSFTDLSAILFAALEQVEGAELLSMQYDVSKNQLAVSLRYPGFDAAEQLKTKLEGFNTRFIDKGTRQSSEGLMGDAIIRPAS